MWFTQRKKEWIKAQWLINPRCSICGNVTELCKTRSQPVSNTATFGHLYAKSDIRRYLDRDSAQLECQKCNSLKSVEENVPMTYARAFGSLYDEHYPELLIALAETSDNEIFLTQIEFKRDT